MAEKNQTPNKLYRQKVTFLTLTVTFAIISLGLAIALIIVSVNSSNKINEQTDIIAAKTDHVRTLSSYVKGTSSIIYEYLSMCEKVGPLKDSNPLASVMWTWCASYITVDAREMGNLFDKIQKIPEFKGTDSSSGL